MRVLLDLLMGISILGEFYDMLRFIKNINKFKYNNFNEEINKLFYLFLILQNTKCIFHHYCLLIIFQIWFCILIYFYFINYLWLYFLKITAIISLKYYFIYYSFIKIYLINYILLFLHIFIYNLFLYNLKPNTYS